MCRRNMLLAVIAILLAVGIIWRLALVPRTPYQLAYRHAGAGYFLNLDTGVSAPVEGSAPFDTRSYERISPDGRWIARWKILIEWYWWQLELEESSSGQVQVLGEFSPCDATVSWSPDSQTLAFAFLIDPSPEPTVQDNERCEIHTYSLESESFTRITHNGFAETSPAFSPDESKLVFTSLEDGYNRLYIMDLQTAQRTMVTRESFGYRAAWSPDGKWIAFMSNHLDWNDDIYIIAPDGTGLRRLTTDRGVDDYPQWVSLP
jgi:hypothetical protein